jgi:hypothetical protein
MGGLLGSAAKLLPARQDAHQRMTGTDTRH